MRVLMFGWEFPPAVSGGLGVACYGLTRALHAAGVKLFFVLPKVGSSDGGPGHLDLLSCDKYISIPSVREQIHAEGNPLGSIVGVDTILRPYVSESDYEVLLRENTGEAECPESGGGQKSAGWSFKGSYGSHLMQEVFRYSSMASVFAKRFEHDVIHAHDWMTAFAGLAAKKISKKPLVLHIHALELDRSAGNPNQKIYEMERLGMLSADKVIAVSRYTKELIIEHYGIAPDKIRVVYNGLLRRASLGAKPRIRAKKKEKTVLFLGRITRQKGPQYFVEAARIALECRKDLRFVVAGSGDMLPAMKRRVRELGIEGHFDFLGFLNAEEVKDVYAASDVYVMPSVSEPFGLAPLEAMDCGVPVVLSRQSGVSEILKHVLKVDFWDSREIANKILAVLSYDSLATQLKEMGAREVRGIRWEGSGEMVLDLYKELVSPRAMDGLCTA